VDEMIRALPWHFHTRLAMASPGSAWADVCGSCALNPCECLRRRDAGAHGDVCTVCNVRLCICHAARAGGAAAAAETKAAWRSDYRLLLVGADSVVPAATDEVPVRCKQCGEETAWVSTAVEPLPSGIVPHDTKSEKWSFHPHELADCAVVCAGQSHRVHMAILINRCKKLPLAAKAIGGGACYPPHTLCLDELVSKATIGLTGCQLSVFLSIMYWPEACQAAKVVATGNVQWMTQVAHALGCAVVTAICDDVIVAATIRADEVARADEAWAAGTRALWPCAAALYVYACAHGLSKTTAAMRAVIARQVARRPQTPLALNYLPGGATVPRSCIADIPAPEAADFVAALCSQFAQAHAPI
jgi:hypothetical protein